MLAVIDTLRADHLSCYGYARPTSPHIDALGAAGAVFEDATAQSSWTLPSMASMLVGRHVFVNAQRLPDGVPSLAERLAQAGYETVAFVGNPALTQDGGNYGRGFATYIGRESTGNVTWDAADLRAAAADWLAAHPAGERPRFVYLHFLDPHFPYAPKDRETLPGEVKLRDDTLAAWAAALKAAPAGDALHQHFNEERVHILSQIDGYDREIANVDQALADVLALLGPRPRLVAVASDHGEGLWDHLHHAHVVAEKVPAETRTLREVFFRDHSYHLYQELVRTPLVLSGPGIAAGQRSATPVENVDIVPTFLRAAGLPDDPELDGRALQDVLSGAGRPRPVVFSFCNEATEVRATEQNIKLVFPTPTGDKFGMPVQLYNLTHDPHERKNLAEDAGATEALRHLVKQRETAADAFHLYDNQEHGSTDPDHLRVLEELGYVGK